MTNTVTWDDVSVSLGVPVREIHRFRKIPTSPGDSKDIGEWQAFLTQTKAVKGVDLQGLPPTSYDEAIAAGRLGFDDAKQHALIVEQEIINEARRDELKKARGALLTRERVREYQAELVAKFKSALAAVPDAAAADVPAHEKPARLALADRILSAVLTKLDNELAGWTQA